MRESLTEKFENAKPGDIFLLDLYDHESSPPPVIGIYESFRYAGESKYSNLKLKNQDSKKDYLLVPRGNSLELRLPIEKNGKIFADYRIISLHQFMDEVFSPQGVYIGKDEIIKILKEHSFRNMRHYADMLEKDILTESPTMFERFLTNFAFPERMNSNGLRFRNRPLKS